MFIFSVKDMHACDSALAVIRAVKSVDLGACVHVSLARRGVEIVPSRAGATELSDAISRAGFTPLLLPRGYALPGVGRTPPKIPFEGHDHDLGSIELRD